MVGFGWDQAGQLGADTKNTAHSSLVKMRGLGPEAGPEAPTISGLEAPTRSGREGEEGGEYGPARLVAAGDTHVLVAPARGSDPAPYTLNPTP